MTVSEPEARRVAEAARQREEGRRPSFARELFLGRFRLDLVHPRPAPDPEESRRDEEFLARLAAFCRTEIDGRRIEREARIPDRTIAGLRELGAFGMRIAPEYGGLGLGHRAFHRALALVASASPAVSVMLSAHQSLGVPQPLTRFGTEEQRRAFLPRCARGAVSAFLLTEPDVGSDPARLNATAARVGEEYVLNGVKLWTTNGVVAELFVVLAKAPGGITAFVVEADSPGITVEHRNSFMGLRGIENGVTRLDGVRVPAANRIGPEGAGLGIALSTLDTGRLSVPAVCVGAGKWCLKIAREWSAARVQGGRPLAEHEAVGAKISFIAATTFALEALVELAGELADGGRRDFRVEAALAKLYASEMAWRMADELVQIRGGRGFETADSLAARGERGVPAEQLLRDLRISRILEGSSEIMRLLIAREAVAAHLSVAGDLIDPGASFAQKRRAAMAAGAFYTRWLPRLAAGRGQLPLAFGEFRVARYGDLSAHLRYAERACRRLARAMFYGMSRWQGRLEDRQGFLGRIVDIGAELFAITAACSRAEHLRGEGTHAPEAYQLADAFCRQARERAEEHFRHLWHNTDDSDRALTRTVQSGDCAWLEEGVLDGSTPGPWIAEAAAGPARGPGGHRPIS